MTTRSTRSKILKEPTKKQPNVKKVLLNSEKPIRTADLDGDVEFVLREEPPSEHYVLTEFKNDTEEEENEINFVLSDNFNVNQNGPLAQCTEEIHIEEIDDDSDEGEGEGEDEEMDDAIVMRAQEILEHVCGKCSKTFRTVKALKRHISFCIFSAELVNRRKEMLKNVDKIEKEAMHMQKKDICFCCGDSFDTCHAGHITCNDCPKTFKTQLSLERHMFLIHSENNDFPCEVCNGKIRTQALLELHMDQHKTRGKPFGCKRCGKEFTRAFHLKRHMNFSACGGNKAPTMSCNVCQKEFVRLDNLRSHLKTHLGQGSSLKKSDYMCPCCKKCFYSLSTLNIHVRTHTGERPFDCDLCDKNFPSQVALKKHRRFHTGEKPYTCSVCNSKFAVKEVLNRHMKRHTGEKPHACDECGKRFIQATQLKNHLRTHARPFECPDCSEKFKTEKQLSRHVKAHLTETKKKPNNPNILNDKPKPRQYKEYNCEDCGVTYKTITAFLRHELSEQHIRSAKKNCEICGVQFKNTKALQFHMLKDHESTDTPREPQSKTVEDAEFKAENEDVIIQQYVLEAIPEGNASELPKKPSPQSYKIIPKSTETSPENVKASITKDRTKLRSELRKSMAECLRDSNKKQEEADVISGEEIEITENVRKLLDMLVDVETLHKFGWPSETVESVLCKVIENCGHDMKEATYTDDYCTRMREYVKLLFTVVIQNDTVKELLNNYPIDEVISFVLSNDDDNDVDD